MSLLWDRSGGYRDATDYVRWMRERLNSGVGVPQSVVRPPLEVAGEVIALVEANGFTLANRAPSEPSEGGLDREFLVFVRD